MIEFFKAIVSIIIGFIVIMASFAMAYVFVNTFIAVGEKMLARLKGSRR
jgi:hypothetical protein